MAKRWKKEELTYLKRYAKSRRVAELAERFKTDAETIRDTLLELGVAAIDSVPERRIGDDPLVADYSKGLEALQKGNWASAVRSFQKILNHTDQPELAERSRRYLAIAERKVEGEVEVSQAAEDPFVAAVYLRNRGQLDDALELCTRGGRAGKDERFAFLAASLHAAKGDYESAAKNLTAAIEMNPSNRAYARQDSDFAEMRAEPEYEQLF